MEVDVRDGRLLVAVEDDGRGFDPSASRPGDWPHFGLRAMGERAATLGGDLVVGTRPEGGTRLDLTVPLGIMAGAA